MPVIELRTVRKTTFSQDHLLSSRFCDFHMNVLAPGLYEKSVHSLKIDIHNNGYLSALT